MHLDQIIFSNAIFISVALPLGATLLSVVAILLPKSKMPILRNQFQLSVAKILLAIVAVRISVYFAIFLTSDTGLIGALSRVAVVFPVILYAILSFKVAQRLTGMGYNRFLALTCVIPLVGPMIVAFLCVTIHERKMRTDHDENGINFSS